ncbi:phosphate acyltransferase PlsX [Fibrobacterota bacterium]
MICIALDAMGGDKAPFVVVKGAVDACRESNGQFSVVLTGAKDLIQAELDKLGYTGEGIEIFDAPQIVNMDDPPTEVLKNKQDSGLVRCVSLQKAGQAHASISAGNSGAMMAACLMILGRVGKISRPAVTCDLPSLKQETVLLDCGVNVDEKSMHLVHFAVCGSVYAENILKRSNPTVGLLNIGEEEKKGPELIQETYQQLKKAPVNFIGNVEGRDIIKGDVDVIVTPGYTGNIVLKLMEGFYEMHNKLFGKIDTPAGEKFHREWNYSNKGGALLLGLNGTGLITHGRAEPQTIKMAILTGYEMAANKVAEKIGTKLEELE